MSYSEIEKNIENDVLQLIYLGNKYYNMLENKEQNKEQNNEISLIITLINDIKRRLRHCEIVHENNTIFIYY
jgi:hypothetical protein